MRDAFPIVCAIGDRLREREARGQHGWRDAKALIVLVAQAGDWNGASCLADALGISQDAQERIYREVYGTRPASEPAPTEDRSTIHEHNTDLRDRHGDHFPAPVP